MKMLVGPFLFGTGTVVFVFLLQFIFKFLNDLVGKGLSYWVIAQLIGYQLSWMLVLAVPMGMLVATLMAYGKLGEHNEFTIIKSCGGSAFKAMYPSIFAGFVVFVLLQIFNDKVLPETNQKAAILQSDIRELKPTFAIDEGRYSEFQGYKILARKVDKAKEMMNDVTIYADNNGTSNIINAKVATMRFAKDMQKMKIDLANGEIQQIKRNEPNFFRRIVFNNHSIIIKTSGYKLNKSDPSSYGRSDRTMNIEQMKSAANTADSFKQKSEMEFDKTLEDFMLGNLTFKDSVTDAKTAVKNTLSNLRSRLESSSSGYFGSQETSNQYWVEIHKKYSIPFACLIFVFVGAPLGLIVKRGNFGVSAAIALGFFVIYWAFLVVGEKLSDRLLLSPFWAMWLGDFIIGIIGVLLTIFVSRETLRLSSSR